MKCWLDLPPLVEGQGIALTDDEMLDGDGDQWLQTSMRIVNSMFADRTAILEYLARGKTDLELLTEAGEKFDQEVFEVAAAEERRERDVAERAARVAEEARKRALQRVYLDPLPVPDDNPPLAFWREDNAHLLLDPCAYCGAPSEHLDHIAPRYRGGPNTADNATGACARCNISKGKKPLLYWLATRDQR